MTINDQNPTETAKICATCGGEIAADARWCGHCVDVASLPNAESDYGAAPARPEPSEQTETYAGPPSYSSNGYGTPSYGQPAFGQPAFGQPAFGQPAFGQPGYGPPLNHRDDAAGWPTPGAAPLWPPAPPTARRTRWVIPTVVAAALVAMCGLVLVVRAATSSTSGSSNTATHTLTVPAAFGGYTLLTDQTAQTAAADMRSQMIAANPSMGNLYSQAMVGIYAPNDGSDRRLVLLGFSGAANPALERQITVGSRASVVDGIMLGANVPSETTYPGGPLGGVLRCGTPVGTRTLSPICAWADGSTIAVVIDATAGDVAGAAADTLALRSAAER